MTGEVSREHELLNSVLYLIYGHNCTPGIIHRFLVTSASQYHYIIFSLSPQEELVLKIFVLSQRDRICSILSMVSMSVENKNEAMLSSGILSINVLWSFGVLTLIYRSIYIVFQVWIFQSLHQTLEYIHIRLSFKGKGYSAVRVQANITDLRNTPQHSSVCTCILCTWTTLSLVWTAVVCGRNLDLEKAAGERSQWPLSSQDRVFKPTSPEVNHQ